MANLTANFSLQNIPLSVYAIIMNLKPILVILLGFCYGVERITLRKTGIILLSFLGASLIVNPDYFAALYSDLTGNGTAKELEDHDPVRRGNRRTQGVLQ